MGKISQFNGDVVEGRELPPIMGRGNKKGNGINMIYLRNMKVGSSIWEVPEKKMLSFKRSSERSRPRIYLKVRMLPSRRYAIQRIK